VLKTVRPVAKRSEAGRVLRSFYMLREFRS